jgi:hypothetical protein
VKLIALLALLALTGCGADPPRVNENRYVVEYFYGKYRVCLISHYDERCLPTSYTDLQKAAEAAKIMQAALDQVLQQK